MAFSHFRRADPKCPDKHQYFRCAGDDSIYCCKNADPCGTGFCEYDPGDLILYSSNSSSSSKSTSTSKTSSSSNTSVTTSTARITRTSTATATARTTATSRTSSTSSTSSSTSRSSSSSSSSSSESPTPTPSATLPPPTSTAPFPATSTVPTETPLVGAVQRPAAGAIAGSVVGALVALLLLVAAIWFIIRRKRKGAGVWEGSHPFLLRRRHRKGPEGAGVLPGIRAFFTRRSDNTKSEKPGAWQGFRTFFTYRRDRKPCEEAGAWEGIRPSFIHRREKNAPEYIDGSGLQPVEQQAPCSELDGDRYPAELFVPLEAGSTLGTGLRPQEPKTSPSVSSLATTSFNRQSTGWSDGLIVAQDTGSSQARNSMPSSAMTHAPHTDSISELSSEPFAELDGDHRFAAPTHPPPLTPSPPPPQLQKVYSPAYGSQQNLQLTLTTPDGVILQSNLNTSTAQQRQTNPASEGRSHVMSFMEYPSKNIPAGVPPAGEQPLS